MSTVGYNRKMRISHSTVVALYIATMVFANMKKCVYPNTVSQHFSSPPSVPEKFWKLLVPFGMGVPWAVVPFLGKLRLIICAETPWALTKTRMKFKSPCLIAARLEMRLQVETIKSIFAYLNRPNGLSASTVRDQAWAQPEICLVILCEFQVEELR